MKRKEDKNPINRIEQFKLRPVNQLARTVTSKSDTGNQSASVKCPFCGDFVDSKKLRIHLRDVHPNARRGNVIVCEKCGLQFNHLGYPRHLSKCQGDKEIAK